MVVLLLLLAPSWRAVLVARKLRVHCPILPVKSTDTLKFCGGRAGGCACYVARLSTSSYSTYSYTSRHDTTRHDTTCAKHLCRGVL